MWSLFMLLSNVGLRPLTMTASMLVCHWVFINAVKLFANISWALLQPLGIWHQWQHSHSIVLYRWWLSALIVSGAEKIGASHSSHSIPHYRSLIITLTQRPSLWVAKQIAYWIKVSVGRWECIQVKIPQQGLVFRVDCCLAVLLPSLAY